MTRYDFVYLFDATDANPNGDPDAGNLPRVDPETGHGLVTDVCLKRKVRNYVAMKGGDGTRIYFSDGAVLNNLHLEGWQAAGLDKDKDKSKLPKDVQKARDLTAFMCRNFFDIRTFGAVMSTEVNCGQVRGPVQLSFARSIEPIISSEHAITRSSVTNPRDLEKGRTMGRKFTIPYGLYQARGVVNPHLASQTGFGEGDLALLWESLIKAFDFDQSAARPAGSMAARRLVVFKHDSALGNAPAHKLFERVSIKRTDETRPTRAYADYVVAVNSADLPAGIKVIDMI